LTAPSPFSPVLPALQISWDATSLRALMACPRRYEYSILRGFRTPFAGHDSPHLAFGHYFASAVETFHKARLAGKSKDEAQLEAVAYVMKATWDEATGTIWGGHYETQWHCLGTEPYKNAKGNKAKCPFSHKGKWFPEPAPTVCGECGSETEVVERWVPADTYKDRFGLVRLVAWYCEEQAEEAGRGIQAYAFPDGRPAVELPVRMPLPIKSETTGEQFIACGYIDRISLYGLGELEEHFITDNKTTSKGLGPAFFESYAVDIQFAYYDLLGSIGFPDLNIKGCIIEGAQVQASGAMFAWRPVYFKESSREELVHDLGYWLSQAEKFARDGYWPMNRASCFLCQYKSICAMPPESREMYLKANWQVDKWNPLEER